jgi:hypothetical protein
VEDLVEEGEIGVVPIPLFLEELLIVEITTDGGFIDGVVFDGVAVEGCEEG